MGDVGDLDLYLHAELSADRFHHQTINGPQTYHVGLNVYWFTAIMGAGYWPWLRQGLGVSNYISMNPHNIGTISGIVGLAGVAWGGFILPIMFGYLLGLTGVCSSAFMLLYGGLVSLIWMYWTEVRQTEVMGENALQPPSASLSSTEPRFLARPTAIGHSVFPRNYHGKIQNWKPEDPTFWNKAAGLAHLRRHHLLARLSFATWFRRAVVVRMPAIGFKFTTSELFWLADSRFGIGHLAPDPLQLHSGARHSSGCQHLDHHQGHSHDLVGLCGLD